VSACWAEPLLDEPALADRHRLVTYHRAGFGRSSPIEGPVTMADHAEHCRLLMRELGIETAHVVGHSSSVAVGLQLALDTPDAVHTLVAMDAARPAPQTELQAVFRREFVEPAVKQYRAGAKEGAVDTFLRGVFGPGYREPLEHGLPGAFDQAVADADAFFSQELPALWERWSFTEEHARRITQPVLAVAGENSAPTFLERRDLLCSWLPDAELFDLPHATHLLHLENPKAMAEALSSFFARHSCHIGAVTDAVVGEQPCRSKECASAETIQRPGAAGLLVSTTRGPTQRLDRNRG
jgi:pimeloyl-ACP methyl ester carboxylesterase